MKKNRRFKIIRDVISNFIDAGKTNREIANELSVSPSTVKKVKRLKKKGREESRDCASAGGTCTKWSILASANRKENSRLTTCQLSRIFTK